MLYDASNLTSNVTVYSQTQHLWNSATVSAKTIITD